MGIISASVTLLLNNIFVVAAIILGTLWYLSRRNRDFFKKKGIPSLEGLPLLGNMGSTLTQKESFAECFTRIYNSFPDASVVGVFEFMKLTYMIRDPEMIKQICIKDFDSFMNHRSSIDHEADDIFGRNLFAIKDQRWKDMRTILSPAFTGSKMRFMFDLIRDCAKRAFDYIEMHNEGRSYDFEAKDLFTRLSNDVIATSAFGLEVNSFEERDNTFYKSGRRLTNFDAFLSFKFFLLLNFPKLMNKLKIPILDKKTSNYFRDIVIETMNHRKQSGIVRPDIIQLLVQKKAEIDSGKNKEGIEWVEMDFVAQSVLFFLAGFDTTAQMFTFMAYELALNKDIQERLAQEIEETHQNLEGKPPSYEDISKLKYLDMVVQESLRKWPPAIQTDRECTKPTTIRDSKGFELKLNRGDSIVMPTFALHRDPRFFPNPEKFDPERFSDENKANIDQFAYQPFGIGPRQCIGNRFALMESKVIFFYILSRFSIETNSKTEIPLELKKGVFQNVAKRGVWLTLKPKKH